MSRGNEPAHPTEQRQYDSSGNYDGQRIVGGLTKHEHFAAMAMQGLCANPSPDMMCGSYRDYADEAIKYADALLAALEKQQ